MLMLLDPVTDEFATEEPPSIGVADLDERPRDAAQPSEYPEENPSPTESVLARARLDVDADPASLLARERLGLLLLASGQYEAAIAELRPPANDSRRRPIADAGYARALALLGRPDEALAIATKLKEQPSSSVMGLAIEADVASRTGDHARAVDALRHLVLREPTRSGHRVELARALLRRGNEGDIRDAVRTLRSCLRLTPTSSSALQVLGVAHAMRGELDSARTSFLTALHINPGYPDAIIALAKLMVTRGDYPAVLSLPWEPAAFRLASRCEFLELRAWSQVQLKAYKPARTELMTALSDVAASHSDMPTQARLTNNLGVCYVLLRQTDNAEKMFQGALRLAPTGGRAPYVNLGRLYVASGKFEQSASLLTESLRRFPNNVDAGLLLAYTYGQQERYSEAIALLEGMLAWNEPPASVFTTLGGLLSDANRLAQSIEVLLAGLERFPSDAMLQNNLAYSYLLNGQVDAAKAVLATVGAGKESPYLLATRGLYSITIGDLDEGIAGYEDAERLAARTGQAALMPAIRQKRHLEVARYFHRTGQTEAAHREVLLGLRVRNAGRRDFRR